MQVTTSFSRPTAQHDGAQPDRHLPRCDQPWRRDETVRVASPKDLAGRLSVEEALGRALEEVAQVESAARRRGES